MIAAELEDPTVESWDQSTHSIGKNYQTAFGFPREKTSWKPLEVKSKNARKLKNKDCKKRSKSKLMIK